MYRCGAPAPGLSPGRRDRGGHRCASARGARGRIAPLSHRTLLGCEAARKKKRPTAPKTRQAGPQGFQSGRQAAKDPPMSEPIEFEARTAKNCGGHNTKKRDSGEEIRSMTRMSPSPKAATAWHSVGTCGRRDCRPEGPARGGSVGWGNCGRVKSRTWRTAPTARRPRDCKRGDLWGSHGGGRC